MKKFIQEIVEAREIDMSKVSDLYIMEEDGTEGIAIEYDQTKKEFYIYGWHHKTKGIIGATISCKEFLSNLGLTKKDCLEIFKKEK